MPRPTPHPAGRPPVPTRRGRAGLAALCLAALGLLPMTGVADDALRVQPHWVPQAQFAGFYLAQDRGEYATAGLDVEILPHGPDHPAPRALASGEADIALLYLVQALELREVGVEVVNVAQLLHESSLVMVSLAEHGIRTPEDLDGRRVARWDSFRGQPEALFRSHDVEPEIVDQGATMTALRTGAVEAATATLYNEMVELYLAGHDPDELETISLEEHGVGLAEDGVYVLASTLEERPEAVEAFVRASLRGWQQAFDEPEAAVDAVMERVRAQGEPSNRAHQHLMLEALRPLYLDDTGRLPAPVLDPEDYLMAHTLMRETGTLSREPAEHERFHRPVIDARPE
ncbi:NitT/TauT family transport system substrate-binding protein [Thioalkalivibrio sp. ALE21]|nr:NitT/TauT family transport system substrate-binding protein [Thioalkalivibrio sp. ALE21]